MNAILKNQVLGSLIELNLGISGDPDKIEKKKQDYCFLVFVRTAFVATGAASRTALTLVELSINRLGIKTNC